MSRPRRSGPSYFGPYERGHLWRVHVVTGSGGARKTSYETFASRALAEAFIAGGRDEAQGITVKHAVDAFLDDRRAKGRSENTLIAYRERLAAIVGHVMQRPIRYLAGRGAELYARCQVYPVGHRRAGQRRSADTHQNILLVAQMLGGHAVRQRWLRANPWAEVEPVGKRVHGADKVRLTVDESRALEAWCIERPGDKYAVLTLGYLYLGVRESELTKRTTRDVDDGGRLLWVRRTKTVAGSRRLVVPDPLAGMLRALVRGRASDAPLFLNERGGRLSESMAWHRVTQACRSAGVPVVPPQALRRTHATLAEEAGESALAVARHLGHATGAAPAVTHQAYVGRDAAKQAQVERSMRALRPQLKSVP